jgi:hypothetical protein
MALGSTKALVKMSTRNIPGGKGGRCVRLTTSPPSCVVCHENLGDYTSWNPLGHTGPVTGLLYLYLNNISSVRKTQHCGAFASRFVQWKRNKTFCVFSTLFYKGLDFRKKKNIEYNFVCLFHLKLLYETFVILRRTERGLHVKYPVILVRI